MQYFPGPPGYESIKKGDAKEGAWILILNETLHALKDKHQIMNEEVKNVKKLHLVLKGNGFDIVNKNMNNDIKVKGKLFYGHTGHHRTKVLMEVQEINGIKLKEK